MTTSKQIPAADKIPFWQKIAFSTGGGMDYLATFLTVNTLFMPFFNKGLGVSPTKIGIVLMILRLWDAVSDPVMGNISDNTRTRWGRRRPFMLVGACLVACIYPFIWTPSADWSEFHILVYMTAIGLLFFSAFTLWSMPYYGMQLELTPNYDERTRLTAWMSIMNKIIGLAGAWVMAIITSDFFADPVTGETDLVHGMRCISGFLAAFVLICGILPALFVKERYYETETRAQKKEPLLLSLRETLKCKPLWHLIASSFFIVFGGLSVGSLGQYVYVYVVFDGDWKAASILGGTMATMMFTVGLLSVPVLTKLGERFDKRTMVLALVGVALFGHSLYIFCLNKEYPYLLLIPALFQSTALSSVWLFLPSMKADVADYDELDTSKRREGALNAFYSWFIKAAFTVSVGVGGFMLDLSGFDAAIDTQPEAILSRMTWLFILVPNLIWCAALVSIWKYPLDRDKLQVIRQKLEARRGEI